MKNRRKSKQFLVLRADGMTFDNIALKLKVTKPTLMKWSKLFKDDLSFMEQLELMKKQIINIDEIIM